MSEMIERVAKAIVKAYSGRDDANWNVFEAEARAAIEAMREPTEGMEAAGKEVDDEYLSPPPGFYVAKPIYQAMIDEALK